MRSRSDWEFLRQEGNIVFIRDLDRGRISVTNDAEEVYTDCQELYGNPDCRVVYQDSEGNWDEILMDETSILPIFRPFNG